MTQDTVNAYRDIRRFYTCKTFPKDGEYMLIDGEGYVAHLKEGNEGCERCCFLTRYGCGVSFGKLDCFDMLNDKRYYFTKENENGEENNK